MASGDASVIDTGIRTLSVAHIPNGFSCDETVANAVPVIASITATLIGLVPAMAAQAQDR